MTKHNNKEEEHPLEALLGTRLLLKVADRDKWKQPHLKNFKQSFSHHGPETTTQKALIDKDFVLLYFSAAWCPPCQKFSPLLKKFYKTCKDMEQEAAKEGEGGSKPTSIEIVYVSSDRDLIEFQEYYSQMPWLALESQHHKTVATKKCHIQGIPSLIVLTGDGKFVTDSARNEVAAAGGKKETVQSVLDVWKATKAVPMDEAQFSNFAPLCNIL